MINLSKISENLKELMQEHNLNQVMLAEKLGSGRTKFSDIINLKSAPNYDTIVAIVEFFNCSADYVLGISDYPCESILYKRVKPFDERIKQLLAEKNISQYKFINQTKISWSVFYKWLTGKSKPSADSLVRLANYFDCSVDFLLGRV